MSAAPFANIPVAELTTPQAEAELVAANHLGVRRSFAPQPPAQGAADA